MVEERQLRLLPAEAIINTVRTLSQSADKGDQVAKYLHKWGMRASVPYFLYGAYSGFAHEWWPSGLSLFAAGALIYGAYDYFYARYLRKPEDEKFKIRRKVAFLERRPKVSVSWE